MTALRTIAQRALKHSGKNEWQCDGRFVYGYIGDEPFTVAAVDEHDELPLCAGEAIARYIEAAQPSVVIALLDEIERLRAAMSALSSMIPPTDLVHFDDASIGADDDANGVPA